MLVFLILVSLSVITGKNKTSCGYSIELLDAYGDGWNGSTASVLVNDISVLTNITVPYSSGTNETFNFAVNPGANISVIYSDSGHYKYEESYIVSTSANATGNRAYSSIPYYTRIINPCQLDICFYSVVISKVNPVGTNNFSLYVNNEAEIFNAFFPDESQRLVINFNVSKGEPIVGLINFPNQNDYRNNNYILCTESNAGGRSFFNWNRYIFAQQGPKTPATIPNFCGVPALQLIVTLGSNVTGQGQTSIPVAVVPSTLAQSTFAANLTLFCNDGSTKTVQNRLTSLNDSDFFYFDAPGSPLGCYFVASSDDVNYPYAESNKVYVSIPYPASPFGGELSYISPEQVDEFTKSLSASSSWMKLTSLDQN